jgi:cytochrome c-type biogenesis protein CcmE
VRLTILGLVFFSAIAVLLWLGFQAGSVPHYTIPEVRSAGYGGEECRIDGAKVASIENPAGPLRFTVQAASGETMAVISPRNPPDNFGPGKGVALRGYFRRPADAPEGVFEAHEVLTSCPSKYEGEAGAPGGKAPALDLPGLPAAPAS